MTSTPTQDRSVTPTPSTSRATAARSRALKSSAPGSGRTPGRRRTTAGPAPGPGRSNTAGHRPGPAPAGPGFRRCRPAPARPAGPPGRPAGTPPRRAPARPAGPAPPPPTHSFRSSSMLGGNGEQGWGTSISPPAPSIPTTTVLGATETSAVTSARLPAELASSASPGKGTTRNTPRTGRPVQWRHRATVSSQQSRSTCQGSWGTSRSQRGSIRNRTSSWDRTTSAAVAAMAPATRPRATSSELKVSTKASQIASSGTYQAIQNPTLRAMADAPCRRLGQAYGAASVGMRQPGQHVQEQGGRAAGRAGLAASDGHDLAAGRGRVDQLDPGQGAG